MKTKTLTSRIKRFAASATTALTLSMAFVIWPMGNLALACAFDLTKPERSAIDWIVDAETLVLARPDPENPFSYQVIEVLRGPETHEQIPFLVSSLHKKRLEQNQSDSVIFARNDSAEWIRVAYLNDAFKSVLTQAIGNADLWADGFPRERFAAFEALQNHADSTLRALAVQELDKAPYEMLREIDLQIPVEGLIAQLWTPDGYPFQPIRVLLLGLSDDDRARKEIYSYFSRTHDWSWVNNIGAFSAALIELDGVAGVEYLDTNLMTGQTQPLDKLQNVISALAVQRGVADADVSLAIDLAISRMVMARPETAPVVAQQFMAFSNWSQAKLLKQVLQENRLMTTADLMLVSVYLAQSRSAASAALVSDKS